MIFEPKKVSESIKNSLNKELLELNENNIIPTLSIIRTGEDIGSISYEKSILANLEPLGINIKRTVLDENINKEEFFKIIEDQNNNNSIDSILILKPYPLRINEEEISTAIAYEKDVDGINPINLGKLFLNNSEFLPCTPEGILELLNYYHIDLKGKNITIINNSDTIGKPLALLLTNEFATVTICHIFTKDLKKYTQDADIIITAAGKYGLIEPDMINENVTLIDVAVTQKKDKKGNLILKENGKSILCGDALESCLDKAANILSLSPGCGGGTGSITTALMARHVINAAKHRKGKNDNNSK